MSTLPLYCADLCFTKLRIKHRRSKMKLLKIELGDLETSYIKIPQPPLDFDPYGTCMLFECEDIQQWMEGLRLDLAIYDDSIGMELECFGLVNKIELISPNDSLDVSNNSTNNTERNKERNPKKDLLSKELRYLDLKYITKSIQFQLYYKSSIATNSSKATEGSLHQLSPNELQNVSSKIEAGNIDFTLKLYEVDKSQLISHNLDCKLCLEFEPEEIPAQMNNDPPILNINDKQDTSVEDISFEKELSILGLEEELDYSNELDDLDDDSVDEFVDFFLNKKEVFHSLESDIQPNPLPIIASSKEPKFSKKLKPTKQNKKKTQKNYPNYGFQAGYSSFTTRTSKERFDKQYYLYFK